MKKSIVRRIAAATIAAGMTVGIALIGAAPASADSSWGRGFTTQDSSWGR